MLQHGRLTHRKATRVNTAKSTHSQFVVNTAVFTTYVLLVLAHYSYSRHVWVLEYLRFFGTDFECSSNVTSLCTVSFMQHVGTYTKYGVYFEVS